MAVMALKHADSKEAPNANETASIPLNRIVRGDGNVRRSKAEEGLEELIDSMAAQGDLQSLVVRKARRGKYFVIAGRKRFLALSALAEAGSGKTPLMIISEFQSPGR